MVQTPRLALHLRNVIPVTPVTPRGDGLWSLMPTRLLSALVCVEPDAPLIASLCTISDRIGVNRRRPDRDY